MHVVAVVYSYHAMAALVTFLHQFISYARAFESSSCLPDITLD